ncbi:tyrosine-type recombinase/integrase, partial [Photobacterium sanctipauli]
MSLNFLLSEPHKSELTKASLATLDSPHSDSPLEDSPLQDVPPASQALSSSNANSANTYLVRSKSGIYSFRWNVRVDNPSYNPLASSSKPYKYKQLKVSLRTRQRLHAASYALYLYREISSFHNPSIEQIKATFNSFVSSVFAKKEAVFLSSVDIDKALEDLAFKSRRDYRACWESFLRLYPSICTHEIKAAHIEQWKLSQSISVKSKGKTVSPTTLKKKLRLLSSCFNRASVPCEAEWFQLSKNEARATSKASSTKAKRAFSEKELKELLKLTYEFKADGYVGNGWRYYLPRMAILTGCRLNELAQMRVGDVDLVSAQPHLDINDDHEDKTLKNDSSKRTVPVAPDLKALLEPLVHQRAKDERLFPSLTYSKDNGYNSKPSKWFSVLCREKLKLQGVSFHSFRHYAITKLFNEAVSEELIGSLMGHSIGKL